MKQLTLSKTIGVGLLALSLAGVASQVPVAAQGNTGFNRDNGTRVATEDNREHRDTDWGWLGLLGLAGLAGLRRRQEYHEPAQHRSTAH